MLLIIHVASKVAYAYLVSSWAAYKGKQEQQVRLSVTCTVDPQHANNRVNALTSRVTNLLELLQESPLEILCELVVLRSILRIDIEQASN